MILECACGKMYRVRDEAPNKPTKCPVCGGPLKAAGGSSPNVLAEHPRVREMDERIRQLEKELADAQAQGKPADSGPVLSQAGWSFGGDAGRAENLERELLDLRSRTERQLKDKDRELAQAREALERETAERRKLESRATGLEDKQGRALQEKQKTIEALDASLASYRSKLDELQKRQEAVELQRLSDLKAFESRIREREQQDGGELHRLTESHQRALADLRQEMERKISEKDLLLTDSRQIIDREAGERRRLSEVLTRLQETANRTVKEKDAALTALQATLAAFRTKADALQRRVDDLEQLRHSEQDATAAGQRSREGIRARFEEAGLLAADLDQSLESMDALLSALHERVKRLKGSLEPGAPEPLSPVAAPVSSSFREPEPEPVRPQLSQASAFEEPPAPAPAPEPQPAPPLEPEPKPEPVVETPALSGRVDAPSGVFEVTPEPAEPAAEPAAEAEPAKAEHEEVVDALPLISPPEEEESGADPAKKKGLLSKFFGKKR